MRGLISLFKLRFMLNLQYRAAALAGVFTQIFFGLVMVMIYDAFFEQATATMPMTLGQTITYIWLGQGLLALIPWNGDREVQGLIRNGDVAYELVRPMALYDYWYFKIMAQRIAPTLLRSIPLFLFVNLLMPDIYKMVGPATGLHFLMFVIVVVGSIFLSCALSNIITITTLFAIGDGMDRLFPAIVMFFSGLVIPLSFFPDWLQPVLRILPFSGLMDTPYKLYLGLYDTSAVGAALLHQLVWTVLLVLLGKLMILKASHRIVVQGG